MWKIKVKELDKGKDEIETYTHLSKFVRKAPDNQIDDFWREVGISYRKSISQSKK